MSQSFLEGSGDGVETPGEGLDRERLRELHSSSKDVINTFIWNEFDEGKLSAITPKALETEGLKTLSQLDYMGDRSMREEIVENWIRQLPERFIALHELCGEEKPDILVFLDTSARFYGLVFKEFVEDLGGKLPPHSIQFVAPPQPKRKTDKWEESTEEKLEYETTVLDSIRDRFSQPFYDGKKILIVDESTATGEQLDKMRKAVERDKCIVVTASLGYDSRGLTAEQVNNIDYILGMSELPPFSSHSGFINGDIIGVRKSTLTEAKDASGKVPQSRVSVLPLPSKASTLLRDDVKVFGEMVAKYFMATGGRPLVEVPFRGEWKEWASTSDSNIFDLSRDSDVAEVLALLESSAKDSQNMYKGGFGNPVFKRCFSSVWTHLAIHHQLDKLKPLFRLLNEKNANESWIKAGRAVVAKQRETIDTLVEDDV